VSGNVYPPGDVTSLPGDQAKRGRSAQPDGFRGRLRQSAFGGARLRAYWLSNPGKVMLVATALALALRLYTLSRPGALTGITEYDDGVYLGGSMRITEGQLPYLNFAFIQPPGILELMLPVALIAKLTPAVKALALARLLTALASTACIPLVGNLVRHRGVLVTAAACGILAVYPSDITTAHTLLLEPWMNLCCLIAINLAFRDGQLARPAMLCWAGVALGVAGTIKFWAAAPAFVLLVLCLLVKADRGRRVRDYLIGLVIGFGVCAGPFLAVAPVTFVRSTIFDQAAREGSGVALGIRLASVTGLIDIYSQSGRLLSGLGTDSMFAAGASAAIGDSRSIGRLPILAGLLLIAALAAGYAWQSRRLAPLEWLSLATTAVAAAMIIGYSTFYYHYADFPAPWLALSCGVAAGALAGRRRWSVALISVFSVVILLVAAVQVKEMSHVRHLGAEAVAHEIPPGACVITDEISLTIAADRFGELPPGCPDIIDSLGATLVLSNGVTIQGGAQNMPAVTAQWQRWLSKADYVWLTPDKGYTRRIPWPQDLSTWFNANFVTVGGYSHATGQLYRRITYVPPPGYPTKTP
jgi:alpha-1,2-mannosyltransferase